MLREVISDDRIGESYVLVRHDSGLRICFKKMDDYSTSFALFGTKYGSVNTTFRTADDKDFITVPNGIAHYLEHKLFENDDSDVFSLYAKTGASGNAYTSFDCTCYLFSCTDNFYDSLEILLDFVQKPYFTEETVAKEQGIISQEIRMYDDNPGWRVMFNMLECIYFSNPVKIDIAGTVESIAEITPELLYKCYHAFYNLRNMVLSVAGDLDEERILEICDRKLVSNKDMQLETAFPDEPAHVVKRIIHQSMTVAVPIFNIGFKCIPYDGAERVRADVETYIALSLLADSSTDFYKRLYDEGLINSVFSYEVFSGNGYFVPIFSGESKDPERVFELILEEIELRKNIGFDEDLFESIRKSYYGSLIREQNVPEALASNMLNCTFEGVTAYSEIDAIAELKLGDVIDRLKECFDISKAVLSVIDPIDSEGDKNDG